jgi:hypothetical protein
VKTLTCLALLLAHAVIGFAADHFLITVYDQNYAVVRDVRDFDLSSGKNEVTFDNLSPLILDSPVRISGTGISPLEQMFQYHRINNRLLLTQSLGKQIGLIVPRDTLFGTLVGIPGSGDNNENRFVLRTDRGALQTVNALSVQEYLYATPPADYYVQPAIIVRVESERTARSDVEAAYEVQGLNWRARYLLDLTDDDSTAVLSGWAAVSNGAGVNFDDAMLTLASGAASNTSRQLRIPTDQRVTSGRWGPNGYTVEYMAPPVRMDVASKEARFAEQAITYSASAIDYIPAPEIEELYQVKLYSLPLATDLPDGSEKEFALFRPARIKTSTRYEYVYWQNPTRIGVYVNTINTDSVGLGLPLPAGPVKLYRKRAAGIVEYVGEDNFPAVTIGQPIGIRVGLADGIAASRTRTRFEPRGENKRDEDFQIAIRNGRAADVTVAVQERFDAQWKMLSSSHEYTDRGRSFIEFSVPVPADSQVVLTYSVRQWHEVKRTH